MVAVALLSCVRAAPPSTVEPLEPTQPAQIEIPDRDGTPVAVLPAVPIGVALSPIELERIRRWSARFLATQSDLPLSVIPLDQIDHGLRSPPACAAEMDPASVLARAFPDAIVAAPRSDCSARPCRLVVDLLAEDASFAPGRRFAASVDEPTSLSAWERAAQSLLAGTGEAASEAAADSTARQFLITRRSARGEWGTEPDPSTLTAVFAACHEKGRAQRAPQTIVLDVDPSGAVAGCASYASIPTDWPRPCFCEKASTLRFEEGSAGRRLALELKDWQELGALDAEDRPVTATILSFSSSDPAIRADALDQVLPWVSLCYATTRLREEVLLPVKYRISAEGKPTHAELGGEGAADLVARCAAQYLRFVAFPCPLTAPASVELMLRVTRA